MTEAEMKPEGQPPEPPPEAALHQIDRARGHAGIFTGIFTGLSARLVVLTMGCDAGGVPDLDPVCFPVPEKLSGG